jgi:hypothetical protein
MGNWLGTNVVANQFRKYRPFTEARKFVWALKLKSSGEWKSFCKGELPAKGKLPPDIPAAANNVYKQQGWLGWGDWLGTGTEAPQFRSFLTFTRARAYAHSLKLKSREEWKSFCKGQLAEKSVLPNDIPRSPALQYANKGWKGWSDWLGK